MCAGDAFGGSGSAPVACTPETVNVRTRVHEYGGGDFAVAGGRTFYVDFTDQRIYALEAGHSAPLSPPGARYADFAATPDQGWLLAVEECPREGQEPENRLVAFAPGQGRRRQFTRTPSRDCPRVRFLQLPRGVCRWPTNRLPCLAPSQYALGRHDTLFAALGSPGPDGPWAGRRRGRGRVDFSARIFPLRKTDLRLGSQRLVESLPTSGRSGWWLSVPGPRSSVDPSGSSVCRGMHLSLRGRSCALTGLAAKAVSVC